MFLISQDLPLGMLLLDQARLKGYNIEFSKLSAVIVLHSSFSVVRLGIIRVNRDGDLITVQ